jgi:hypothetical protein
MPLEGCLLAHQNAGAIVLPVVIRGMFGFREVNPLGRIVALSGQS